MSGGLFDVTTRALQTSANMRELKHGVISSNVANAETPGYHAKRLDFEEALGRALDTDGLGQMTTDDPDHFSVGQGAISRVKADIYENPEGKISNDGNTVDLEREMAQLAENSIMYKAAVQLINKKLASLRYAATEGR